MRLYRSAFTVLIFLTAFVGRAGSTNIWFKPPDPALYSSGRYVYQRNCMVCHGQWGDGKGDMASGMIPTPRKFNTAVFKYRSTPPGFLPSDADLIRTIQNGIPGTSMPTFMQLSEREVRAVAEYIKFFSRKWQQPENYAGPLEIPPLPRWFDDKVEMKKKAAAGKVHYHKQCASCHGDNGDGNGPSGKTLVDLWDQPVKAADLRQATLRSGNRPEDLYRVLLTGISGSPMPAFGESLTEEERWELAAFVNELKSDNR